MGQMGVTISEADKQMISTFSIASILSEVKINAIFSSAYQLAKIVVKPYSRASVNDLTLLSFL